MASTLDLARAPSSASRQESAWHMGKEFSNVCSKPYAYAFETHIDGCRKY